MKQLVLPTDPLNLARLYHGFTWVANDYVTGDLWTLVATDSGTATLNDASPPSLSLKPSDGTVADNDEIYLHTTNEQFIFADDRPMLIEMDVEYAEANTDDANVMLGVMDAVAANDLQDDAGGPSASYSGMLFFKVDGGTVWQAENSITTTQKTTELTAANSIDGVAQTAGGSAVHRFRLESRPLTSTKHDVLFWIDDILVAKHKDQVYTNATEMAVVVGAKNGSANNEEIKVRRVSAYQLI